MAPRVGIAQATGKKQKKTKILKTNLNIFQRKNSETKWWQYR